MQIRPQNSQSMLSRRTNFILFYGSSIFLKNPLVWVQNKSSEEQFPPKLSLLVVLYGICF